MFAPVEYLTYEIRNIFNFMKRRGGRPCPPAVATLQQFSIFEKRYIQGRGITFPLVVLRGIPKKGLPRESSEAIRVGKGGTTKRTSPAACGRARDVEFVPTQTPPLPFSFYRQRLFLCRAKKKGLNRLLASSGRGRNRAFGAALCPPGIKSLPHPPDAVPPRLWRGLRPSGRKKASPPGGVTKSKNRFVEK